MKNLIFIGLWVLSCFSTNPPNQEKYCNSRFGFCVEYSENTFPFRFTPLNGDGVILKSADGLMIAQVTGSYNVLNQDNYQHLSELVEEFVEGNEKPEVFRIKGLNACEVQFDTDKGSYLIRSYQEGDQFLDIIFHSRKYSEDYEVWLHFMRKNVIVTLQ